jgi:hypothetical protein
MSRPAALGELFMQAVAPGITAGLFKFRNYLFFFAVLLMHWTLPRPAPGDVVFVAAFLPSLLINPKVNRQALIFVALVLVWTISVFVSSLHVINETDVQFQLLAHTFVVALAFTACLVALSWGERDYHAFMKVYLAACCIAATLGIVGFVGQIDLFLWDGRAKGLFDEPIAFGAFLLPGVFGALYMLSTRRGLMFPLITLVLCIAGVVLSFSRADIFALAVCGPLYYIVLNRDRPARAIAILLIGAFTVLVLAGIALVSFPAFQEKLLSRATIAEPYDVGRLGRYNRYLLSVPLILEHPLGLGMLQIDKYFPEPIHNVFISSFLNYGWLAGVTWILLTLLSFKIAIQDERATKSPIVVWLSFSLLAQLPCAMLQQVEHWRHLWLLLGLLWGFNARNFAPVPRLSQRRRGAPPFMQPAPGLPR